MDAAVVEEARAGPRARPVAEGTSGASAGEARVVARGPAAAEGVEARGGAAEGRGAECGVSREGEDDPRVRRGAAEREMAASVVRREAALLDVDGGAVEASEGRAGCVEVRGVDAAVAEEDHERGAEREGGVREGDVREGEAHARERRARHAVHEKDPTADGDGASRAGGMPRDIHHAAHVLVGDARVVRARALRDGRGRGGTRGESGHQPRRKTRGGICGVGSQGEG